MNLDRKRRIFRFFPINHANKQQFREEKNVIRTSFFVEISQIVYNLNLLNSNMMLILINIDVIMAVVVNA